MSLLAIEDLRVRFDQVAALGGVSLALDKGVRLGLVGESGSGKSTLGLAVLGLLPDAATVTGRVMFNGAALPWDDDRAMSVCAGRRSGSCIRIR